MKLAAMALVGLMMCGCDGYLSPNTYPVEVKEVHNYQYAAQLTNYREDVWQEFQYIKNHKGNVPKNSKIYGKRFHDLLYSIPSNQDYMWEIFEASHIANCELNLENAVFYFGMKIGQDPTTDAEKCRMPHVEGR